EGASLQLVLARQSRDPSNNKIPAGDFDRSKTFDRWEESFKNKFDRIFVPLGTNGLVAMSYHIKVTVADKSKVWLSSGNWKRSSQPLIPPGSLDDPKVTSKAGNREWHVVLENETLAKRFRNHIKADFEQSLELGGTLEAVQEETLVDVPVAVLEAVELEGPAARVLTPLKISRRVRVKPLLTPDKKGAIFSKAVLRLVRSAQSQLLFQNQYISMKGADSGFLKQLVDALVEKSQELDDFRIIVRKENDSLQFDLSQLKRRGIDVENQVRTLSNTHTKGVIVDGKQVLIGSHNWSSLGVTLNRDASLIFDDEEVAEYYREAFEIDWARASEPRLDEAVTEGVRPAEGPEPRPGFVRMTLSQYLEG
ncbi:MAG TPA: phospholipase D-like domain-containing protein, partial [Pyrinomonadaceae bacterium]|nr:phospholipase D-like domain-containing protein [Pyrinomonadaceae bacterium]